MAFQTSATLVIGHGPDDFRAALDALLLKHGGQIVTYKKPKEFSPALAAIGLSMTLNVGLTRLGVTTPEVLASYGEEHLLTDFPGLIRHGRLREIILALATVGYRPRGSTTAPDDLIELLPSLSAHMYKLLKLGGINSLSALSELDVPDLQGITRDAYAPVASSMIKMGRLPAPLRPERTIGEVRRWIFMDIEYLGFGPDTLVSSLTHRSYTQALLASGLQDDTRMTRAQALAETDKFATNLAAILYTELAH